MRNIENVITKKSTSGLLVAVEPFWIAAGLSPEKSFVLTNQLLCLSLFRYEFIRHCTYPAAHAPERWLFEH